MFLRQQDNFVSTDHVCIFSESSVRGVCVVFPNICYEMKIILNKNRIQFLQVWNTFLSKRFNKDIKKKNEQRALKISH